MSEKGESAPKDKTGSGVIIRTKTKPKASKVHRKGRENQNQPIFNDPLYEYLDN